MIFVTTWSLFSCSVTYINMYNIKADCVLTFEALLIRDTYMAVCCGRAHSILSLSLQSMILEVVDVYTDMVNCSLFSDAYEQLNKKRQDRLGNWINFEDPLENSGDWLPQIVRQIR